MIRMLNDCNTEQLDATCYNADIKSAGKTLICFNLSIIYQVAWPNGNGSGFTIEG